MRVSFVFPPFYLESLYNLPPLGLISLATVLAGDGHTPRIHDFVLGLREGTIPLGPQIYQACARDILEAEPQLVAFSAQCATYPAVVRIAELLKRENPALTIMLGGHNASFLDRRTLAKFPFIDIVARGEGEITMRDTARALSAGEDLSGVAGISFRRGGEIALNPERELIDDLNSLPLPDYRLAPEFSRYQAACGLPRSVAILEIGRGCPHACVYCSESVLWRGRCRTYSIERTVGEMRRLRDDFGAGCFLLSYDQFTANRRFVANFCERVIDEGLDDTPWYCISRLDTVDEELLSLMNRAGCNSMCFGIDSGSKRTLAFINKRIDQDILFDRVRAATANGINPTLSFILGFPEEQRGDIDDTLDLALRCGILGNISPLLQLPTVLPGSKLHQDYAGSLVREVDTYFALGLEFDRGRRLATDEALIDSDPQMFSSFYNLRCRAAPLAELAKAAEIFPWIISFFPKSYYLLCQALAASPYALFLEFAAQAAQRSGRERFDLDAAEMRRQFPAFARDVFTRAAPTGFAHLADVVRYELRGLDAAGGTNSASGGKAAEPSGGPVEPSDRELAGDLIEKVELAEPNGPGRPGSAGSAGSPGSPGSPDPGESADSPDSGNGPLAQGRPDAYGGPPRLRKGDKVIVDVFDFDLPAIIEDLQNGIVKTDYPEALSRLIFEYRDGQLEVSEVNAFGNEFLAMCDGSLAVEGIAQKLYPRHGDGMDYVGFVEECERAARIFASMRLVAPAS